MKRAWAFTGAGLITTAGDTPEQLFSRVLQGRPPTIENGAFPFAAIGDFDPREYLNRKGLKYLSRTSQLACAAASRIGSGLEETPSHEIGFILGSAWAGLDTIVNFERRAHVDGPRFVDPGLFAETVPNVSAGQVSIFFGWSAVNMTVAAGTASGLEAILTAIEFLEEDRAHAMVAGGGDGLNPHLLRTLHDEGLTAQSSASMPYTEGARGPIGSEGACLFVVESADRATARGAPILGRARAGVSRLIESDSEDGSAMRATVLRELLDRCWLTPTEIDLLVVSGNGSAMRERTEAAVVREVFGTDGPPALAPKAVLGETWAAAGPLGVVSALESMRHSSVPAKPSNMKPRPEYDALNFPTEPLKRALHHALVLDCDESGRFSALVVSGSE